MSTKSDAKKRKDRIKRIKEEECQEWARNPTVNPLTGAEITVDGPTYNDIKEICLEKYNIYPAGSSRAPLPKSIGTGDDKLIIPKNHAEWQVTFLKINNLYAALQETEKVPKDFLKLLKNYIRLCEIILEYSDNKYDIIPAERHNDDRNKLTQFIAYSKNIVENNLILDISPTVSLLNNLNIRIKGLIDSFLYNGNFIQSELTIFNTIRDYLDYYKFYNLYDNSEGVDDIAIKFYEEIFINFANLNYLILHIKSLKDKQQTSQNKELSKSKSSKSLPSSIKQKMNRKVTRLPKPREFVRNSMINPETGAYEYFMTPKPLNPGEDPFIEKVFYSEKKGTDEGKTDDTFSSHAKLSAMSPYKHEEVRAMPPLSNKKRTQILKDLKGICVTMKDVLTGKRFDRMNKKKLQLIVEIDTGTGKKNCYYARDIYNLWKNAVSENKIFIDPLTRKPIKLDDKRDIMKKIKYIDPKAKNPEGDENIEKIDPNLKLIIEPWLVNLEDGTSVGGFNRIYVKYEIPNTRFARLIGNLGIIPGNLELSDVGGSANMTSAAIAASLVDIFEKGRLLTKNFIPISCCRIHLHHHYYYWSAPDENRPLTKGINMTRWYSLANEVNALL